MNHKEYCSSNITYKKGFQPSPDTDIPPPVPKKPTDYQRIMHEANNGDHMHYDLNDSEQFPNFHPGGTPRITRNPLPPLPTEAQDDAMQKRGYDPNNPNFLQNHPGKHFISLDTLLNQR